MTNPGVTPRSPAEDPHALVGAWSVPATRRTVMRLLEGIDWTHAKVVDVGTGSGPFVQVLGDYVRARHGLEPRDHLFACDLDPSSFRYAEIECDPINADGTLAYPDDTFDAAISIEVIEHVENQFAFLRELRRITRPGGVVIVTTPNTLNINSRIRTLMCGFPHLFDPLPLSSHDPRILGGHIHPISPYYLAYGALRAGLEDIELHSDRTKRSAAVLTTLLSPLLLIGRARHAAWLRRKRPSVHQDNLALRAALSGWTLLTGRTTVLKGIVPSADDSRTPAPGP